jgi:hypothetical protein
MKTVTATPVGGHLNSDDWTVVSAPDAASSQSDLTKLAVGTLASEISFVASSDSGDYTLTVSQATVNGIVEADMTGIFVAGMIINQPNTDAITSTITAGTTIESVIYGTNDATITLTKPTTGPNTNTSFTAETILTAHVEDINKLAVAPPTFLAADLPNKAANPDFSGGNQILAVNEITGFDAGQVVSVLEGTGGFDVRLPAAPYSADSYVSESAIVGTVGNTRLNTGIDFTAFAPVTGVSTTLTAAVSILDSTINVASSAAFPTTLNFCILVDSEIMRVTGIAGTVWTVDRGINDTATAAHALSASVVPANTVYLPTPSVVGFAAHNSMGTLNDNWHTMNLVCDPNTPTDAIQQLCPDFTSGTYASISSLTVTLQNAANVIVGQTVVNAAGRIYGIVASVPSATTFTLSATPFFTPSVSDPLYFGTVSSDYVRTTFTSASVNVLTVASSAGFYAGQLLINEYGVYVGTISAVGGGTITLLSPPLVTLSASAPLYAFTYTPSIALSTPLGAVGYDDTQTTLDSVALAGFALDPSIHYSTSTQL